MRSSIACARCRRSKIKCLNNGVNTTCRACQVSGRECTYPAPVLGDRPNRREGSLTRTLAEGGSTSTDSPKQARPRPKKGPVIYYGSSSSLHSMRALVDALDPTVLTPQIWIELFEIWQLHFAVDLPFLHPPSFLRILRQTKSTTPQQDFGSPRRDLASDLPQTAPELLLAFLCLTSRFHNGLVAHHSPPSASRPSNPLVAAEYYAAACKGRIAGNSGDNLGTSDVPRVQALLMIALHEWGNCQGVKAWTSLGVATRYAQLLGLHYQPELDDDPLAKLSVVSSDLQRADQPESGAFNAEDEFVAKETRRRTFWGCYILDRCLSSGKYRPQMLRIEDARIQLPCSDRAFLFGDKVRTPMLLEALEGIIQSSNGARTSTNSSEATPRSHHSPSRSRDTNEDSGVWESGPYEGIASRYLKATEAYGQVIKWTCGGGRLIERFPPWDTRSTWHSIYKTVTALSDKLPRDLTLTHANVSAHMTSRTSASYILLHTALLLSKIMLHREFLPFLPFRCTSPKGPLDSASPFASGEHGAAPFGFWEQNTGELFRSSRDLLHLLLTCSEWKVLVETPMVGFAAYMISVLGLYSTHFPWMDPNEYMSSSATSIQNRIVITARDTTLTCKAISQVSLLRPRLRMAEGYFKSLGRLHRYFLRMKKELRANFKQDSAGQGGDFHARSSLLPLRMSDEEYKAFDLTFGKVGVLLESEDQEMPDAPLESPRDEGSVASLRVQGQSPEGSARSDRWNAINASGTAGPADAVAANESSTGYHSSQLSPSVTASTGRIQSPNAGQQAAESSATSPGMALPSFGSAQLPSLPSWLGKVPPQASQPQSPAPALKHSQTPAVSWTTEQAEAWLMGLETVFGGDDVVAFVEGRDLTDLAGLSSGPHRTGGWLRLIWTASSVKSH